jgi:hypothetical protein
MSYQAGDILSMVLNHFHAHWVTEHDISPALVNQLANDFFTRNQLDVSNHS